MVEILPAPHPYKINLVFSDDISQAKILRVHYPNPIPNSGSDNEHITTFIYAAFFHTAEWSLLNVNYLPLIKTE